MFSDLLKKNQIYSGLALNFSETARDLNLIDVGVQKLPFYGHKKPAWAKMHFSVALKLHYYNIL